VKMAVTSSIRGHCVFGALLVIVIACAICLYLVLGLPPKCYERTDTDTCESDCQCSWCKGEGACFSNPPPCVQATCDTTGKASPSYYKTVIIIVSSVLGAFLSIGWSVYCCVSASKAARSQQTEREPQIPALPPQNQVHASNAQIPAFSPQFTGQPLMMTAVTGPDGQPQYILTQVPPQMMPPQQYVVSYQPVYM